MSPTGSPPLAPGRVLDMGGGDGTLARLLIRRDTPTVVLDRAAYVRHATTRNPGRCGAIALCRWLFWRSRGPLDALLRARALGRTCRGRTGIADRWSIRGLYLEPYNDPEFAEVMPGWGEPFGFDAETAVDVVAEQFSIIEVRRWDTAVVRLPDVAAVRLFLRGRGLSETAAASEAARRRCPLSVTKRGCLIWACK